MQRGLSRHRFLLLLWGLGAALACSSEGSPGGQDGGSDGGTAGTGGAVGGRDGPVPPAAQGAASFHFVTPASGSGLCSPGSHWANVPFVASTATVQQVSFDSKGPDGTIAVDGVDGAVVSCVVRANGSRFDVTGRITVPVPSRQNTSIFVTTTLGPDEVGASGTLSVSDDSTTGSNYQAGIPSMQEGSCSFSTRPGSGIGPGKVWASVTCTDARSATSPSGSCDFAPAGFFVFENCEP